MQKLGMEALLAVLFCALAAPVRAQGEFPLEYREFTDPSHPLLSMSRSYSGPDRATPDLKGLPKDASGKLTYYAPRVGGRTVLFALDSGSPRKLYTDTDGDRDLSDETPFVAEGSAARPKGMLETLGLARGPSRRDQSLRFGPIPLKTVHDGAELTAQIRVEARVIGSTETYLRPYPSGLMSGTAQLGGRSYRVEIVDVDLDGRYDGYLAPPDRSRCDWLGIDLDGNGRFDGQPYQSAELLPLPRILSVRDTYYRIEPAADGSAVRFSGIEPRLGTLDVTGPDARLRLISESGFYDLASSEGPLQLPVGRYMTAEVALDRTDERKVAWHLSSRWQTGKLADIEIHDGETTSIAAGAPLVGTVTVDVRRGAAYIGFSLHGQAGERYAAGADKNGMRQPAPSFKIIGADGKVLTSGAFEYG